MIVQPAFGVVVRPDKQKSPNLILAVDQLNDKPVTVGKIVLLDVRNTRLTVFSPWYGLDFPGHRGFRYCGSHSLYYLFFTLLRQPTKMAVKRFGVYNLVFHVRLA